jgi:UDP:flavonoid glycosyltransferase YjiC (YdhE family)
MASAWPKQARRAAQGADLLISHGMVYLLGASVGQSLGVPVVETQLMPTLPSRTPPPLPLPKWADKLPGVVNVALGHAARAAVWHTLRPAYNQIVRPALGLPPFPWSGPNNVSHPRLFGYSPALVEPPASWPANVRVTGAWRLEEGACWRPPEALTEFLKAGPPPVYVGFGSMINHAPDAFTTKVLEASRASGKRMILATGWGGLSSLPPDASERIMTIGRAPHDWLFPRMALAVHHGGAGTTAAATWAGIPSVLVPVFGDQPFWAARLAQLGVAPPPLPREKVTAAALTAAILAADSPAMRARAAALGERVRGENGVANALDALAEWRLT